MLEGHLQLTCLQSHTVCGQRASLPTLQSGVADSHVCFPLAYFGFYRNLFQDTKLSDPHVSTNTDKTYVWYVDLNSPGFCFSSSILHHLPTRTRQIYSMVRRFKQSWLLLEFLQYTLHHLPTRTRQIYGTWVQTVLVSASVPLFYTS